MYDKIKINKSLGKLLLVLVFALVLSGVSYAACFPDLPDPIIEQDVSGTEAYVDALGNDCVRYRIPVVNYAVYPDEMFADAPTLPACGLNDESSRSWVDIYDASDDSYIYGFCALGASANLANIWFAAINGASPPAAVYIKIIDRACGNTYQSNTLSIVTPGAPSAVDDTATTEEDTGVAISVLSNDTDPNGAALSLVGIETAPYNGTAAVGGSIIHYTPNADYIGTDTFYYTVTNGVYSDVGMVIVTVNSVNDPPDTPSNLQCNGDVNPENVSDYTPSLSWSFSDSDSGSTPGAYQIIIGTSEGASDVWDSGKVTSTSTSADYSGADFPPNTNLYWTVRVWDSGDAVSNYAASATFTILDIGLRLYDGTETLRVAADYISPAYSLRIHKEGTTYGIILVDPSDADASALRVQTSTGLMAVKKM